MLAFPHCPESPERLLPLKRAYQSAHRKHPLFCVQYHPEAAPGPHDSAYLFKTFREMILKA
jgi:carbamoylphosphate synthase small subunit